MISAAEKNPRWPLLSERAVVVFTCLVVVWFYGWTARSSGRSWNFGTEQRDYYNLLIDGYLAGQLHMKVEVPEALLRVKDPYDPAQRPPGSGMHDASFYRGKYYVYFGAAPMVMLMLPFRLIAGVDLPLPAAVLVFITGGFLASVAVWGAVRRRYFPETGLFMVVAGVLVLGLTAGGPVILRRPDMWELPLAGGYCFAALTLAAIWRSLHETRGRRVWLALAGLCYGLAIASRPTYLIASPLFAVPLFFWWREQRRFPWALVLCLVAPLALVGSLMAWHNYARFGDPLQFGQAYQLSLDYESKLPHFRAAYVPYTLRLYFFSLADGSSYFPFIHRADAGSAPAGFTIHRGDVYGLLIYCPVAWLALFAPVAIWRRSAEERSRLIAWIGAVIGLFGLSAVTLMFFFSALARYEMDFVPALMLLAAVGLLAVGRWIRLTENLRFRPALRVIVGAMALGSAAFGVLFSLTFDGLLGERNPALEFRVARALNRIPAVIERIAGLHHGAVEFTVRLAPEIRPGREILVTRGKASEMDRVFVRTLDGGKVQLGVVPSGGAEQLSEPLTLDPNQAHRVRVTLGSLFPPVSHPYFADLNPDEVRRTLRQLRLEVDGVTVLFAYQRTGDATSRELRGGVLALSDTTYRPFRGSVGELRRVQADPVGPAESAGTFARLRLEFPPTTRGWEPLVAFGEAGATAILAVSRVAPGSVRFAWRGSREAAMESDPITLAGDRVQELVIRADVGREAGRRYLYLWLNGERVWSRFVAWDAGDAPRLAPGRNVSAVPGIAAEFSGRIHDFQADALGRDPLTGSGDTMRLRVRWPVALAGQREPLIVTGRSGAGDMLLVEYLDAQTVRFAFDHWGSPLLVSASVRLDAAVEHDLAITLTSLETVEDASRERGPRPGKVRIAVDGVVGWDERVEVFAAESAEVAVGRNPIGGTSCGPVFTGELLAVERPRRE